MLWRNATLESVKTPISVLYELAAANEVVCLLSNVAHAPQELDSPRTVVLTTRTLESYATPSRADGNNVGRYDHAPVQYPERCIVWQDGLLLGCCVFEADGAASVGSSLVSGVSRPYCKLERAIFSFCLEGKVSFASINSHRYWDMNGSSLDGIIWTGVAARRPEKGTLKRTQSLESTS